MSFTFNRVTLIARAAANPEVRLTNGGQRVATLNLATERGCFLRGVVWSAAIPLVQMGRSHVATFSRGRLDRSECQDSGKYPNSLDCRKLG